MGTEYCLLVHHTTCILEKLGTWCLEDSGDISCSLLVNLSQTDESWQGRNTCVWIYGYNFSMSPLENTDENRIFFVCLADHKDFGKSQHLPLRALS